MINKFVFSLIMLPFGVAFLFGQSLERKNLSITVYNDNLGVVRDVRTADLPKGKGQLSITDVAEQLITTSVKANFDGNVVEQNFQYDIVSVESILKKYIDKNIVFVNAQELINGTLLSSNGNNAVVRRDDNSLVIINNTEDFRINLAELPDNFTTRPTLIWDINANKAGKQDIEISYMTEGINWDAQYVGEINQDETKLSINAWVSITNNSGTDYANAQISLIAGQVNRANILRGYADYAEMNEAGTFAKSAQFNEKPVFEYHKYDLQRATTLKNREQKQIELFQANNIKFKKQYYYNAGTDVDTYIEFANSKDNNLGMPMPKGIFRLNQHDDKSNYFIGEDFIDHTPKDEQVKLSIGKAFDIKAEEKITSDKWISTNINEKEFEITIKNRKDVDINVNIVRYIWGNVEIISSTHELKASDANKYVANLPCKKNSETIMKYKVRYIINKN